MSSAHLLSPLLETVRARGQILRTILVVVAAMDLFLALSSLWVLLSPGSERTAVPFLLLFSHMPNRLFFFVVLIAFLAWSSACQRAVQELLRRSLDINIAATVAAFFCVPVFGVVMPVRVVTKLAAAVDPSSLPPVTVEQEQAGGFRDNAVQRVETGSIASPVVWLWGICWVGAQVCPIVLTFASAPNAGHLISFCLELLSAVLLFRVTRAISHNLTESFRRMLFRSGADPASL